MRMPTLMLFAFLLVACLLIYLHRSHIPRISVHKDFTDERPWMPYYSQLMLLAAIVTLAFFLKVLLANHHLSCPYQAILIICCFLLGILGVYNNVVRDITDMIDIKSSLIILIYMPLLMFNIAFSLDVPIFLKTLPQVVVMGVPVCILTAASFGVMAKMIINPTWAVELGLLFGLLCCATYPVFITNIYKQQSARTRQISVLVEGEALLTLLVADIIQRLVFAYVDKFVVKWYQFLAVLTRFFLLGILHGYLMGLLGRYLIKKMYTYKLSVYMVCFLLPFVAYLGAQGYTNGCGSIVVTIMGAMLAMERRTMTKEVEKFLLDFWCTLGFIVESIVCAKCAIVAGADISSYLSHSDYVLMLGIYLLYFITRFCCYLLFSPILKRLGYGMDMKNMMMFVWSGLKCPISLELVGSLKERNFPSFIYDKFFFHIFGLYFLSNIVNGSCTAIILKSLELTTISKARQMTMNNCMKHIFSKRNRTIAILKHDRFLADTNWAVVIEFTNMKHPYQDSLETDEDDISFLSYKYTFCSDCMKEVPLEPTPKEMREMMKEAKKRVLKAKKMSYSRQYENGMMSDDAIRILSQAVELAMDSDEGDINIKDLFLKYLAENWFQQFVRKRVETVSQKKSITRPPRTYWRRKCYHLVVTHKTLDKFMLGVVICNLVMIAINLYLHPVIIHLPYITPHPQIVDIVIIVLQVVFMIIYLLEFIIKVMAYSWIHVCSHGFRTYFKSVSNCLEFIPLVACVLEVFVNLHHVSMGPNLRRDDFPSIRETIALIQLVRVLRLFLVFHIFHWDILVYMNRWRDSRIASAYELGKSYATGDGEIVDMLPQMIDNRKIREEIYSKIEKDRTSLTTLLGVVQKKRPWVAITVKTKQAIRTILNGMNEGVEELKSAGWLDFYEHYLLTMAMGELLKRVDSINKVHPSPPKVIFNEVAWMAEDEAIIEFLFENVVMKTYEPGDVVFAEGVVADGIYIVVTGLLMTTYTPKAQVIKAMHELGKLPIVDYLPGNKFQEPNVDYIVSGNCIGELSTLTGRSYNSVITADAHSQVYAINRSVLNRAMELSPDSVAGLECRIWKEISVRIAAPLLMGVPAYQGFSQEQIKEVLERAFVPNLAMYKIFTITDVIDDVVLIEGLITDFITMDVFVAPCYIPRTAQKLIMPASSLVKVSSHGTPKLLIIPSKDVDEFDVMAMADEMCEVISGSSTKCLQHVVYDRSRRRKRLKMRGLKNTRDRSVTSLSSRRRGMASTDRLVNENHMTRVPSTDSTKLYSPSVLSSTSSDHKDKRKNFFAD